MASKHVLRLSGILCGNEAGKLARRDIVRIVAGAQRVLTRHGTGDSWGKRLAIVVRDGRSKLQAVAPRPRKAFHVRAGAHDRQLRALHKVMAEMYELARTQTAAPLGEPVTGVPASEDVQAGDAVDLKDLEDPQLDGGDQDNADGKYAHAGAAVDLEDPRRDGGDQGRDGGSDPGGDQGRDGGSDPGGGQGRDGGSAPGSRDEGSAPGSRDEGSDPGSRDHGMDPSSKNEVSRNQGSGQDGTPSPGGARALEGAAPQDTCVCGAAAVHNTERCLLCAQACATALAYTEACHQRCLRASNKPPSMLEMWALRVRYHSARELLLNTNSGALAHILNCARLGGAHVGELTASGDHGSRTRRSAAPALCSQPSIMCSPSGRPCSLSARLPDMYASPSIVHDPWSATTTANMVRLADMAKTVREIAAAAPKPSFSEVASPTQATDSGSDPERDPTPDEVLASSDTAVLLSGHVPAPADTAALTTVVEPVAATSTGAEEECCRKRRCDALSNTPMSVPVPAVKHGRFTLGDDEMVRSTEPEAVVTAEETEAVTLVPIMVALVTAAASATALLATAAAPATAPLATAAAPATAPLVTAAAPATAPLVTAAAPATAPLVTVAAPATAPLVTAAAPATAPLVTAAPATVLLVTAAAPATGTSAPGVLLQVGAANSADVLAHVAWHATATMLGTHGAIVDDPDVALKAFGVPVSKGAVVVYTILVSYGHTPHVAAYRACTVDGQPIAAPAGRVQSPSISAAEICRIHHGVHFRRNVPVAWMTHFAQLQRFKELQGHCRIPTTTEYAKLRVWVGRQRAAYHITHRSKTCVGKRLSDVRVAQLETLGFQW